MSTRHSHVAKHIKLKIQSFISFIFFSLPLDHPRPTQQPFLSVILSTPGPEPQQPLSAPAGPWHFSAPRGAVFQI